MQTTEGTLNISVPVVISKIVLDQVCSSSEFEYQIRQICCESRVEVMSHTIAILVNLILNLGMSLSFLYEMGELHYFCIMSRP